MEESQAFLVLVETGLFPKTLKSLYTNLCVIQLSKQKMKALIMMGDTNFQRVPWDEEETALLIEAYQQSKLESNRREIVAKLSKDLRGRAESKGIDIDDKFRNENGVSMRMAEIACLFGDEDNRRGKIPRL